ncbi:MAG: flagellar motor protein MotB [Candidatus Latescibacteria bacterium]|nr:flagellar motor protein MotB [Candidatus Latescibacterota bacterium]
MPFGGIPHAKGEEEESATWYITYGDTFTLMVTFFILLFANATFDPKKYEKFIEAEELKQFQKLLDSTYTVVTTYIQQNNLQDKLKAHREETAIRLIVSADISFAAGKSDLKREVFPILDSIGDIFRNGQYAITVSGHTDNVPMRGNKDFPTNWELSAERALSVTKYFIGKGFDTKMFRSEGLAEFRPLLPDTVKTVITHSLIEEQNTTPELRSQNRRIEITVAPIYKSRFSTTA